MKTFIIKPLQWHFRSTPVNEVWSASTLGPYYELRRYRHDLVQEGAWSSWWLVATVTFDTWRKEFQDLDHGKALAQEDWEKRLGEYLEEKP